MVDDPLSTLVRRFWEQKECGTDRHAKSPADLECEAHFSRTHSWDASGRYSVQLPCGETMPDLAGTRSLALRTLYSTEQRFARDETLREKYAAFLREYESLGHMTRVPSRQAASRVCYLPHHGVMKGDGLKAKIRVVFNGSAKLHNG
ncbi:uncharacterized protein [Cardiocondyla obscurior]|uniref:uncharacterized protein n=1 Tax=Cardiocondyla obscurior TaxID=286306 RepID=UPI0039658477